MARHPHADLIKEWAEDTSRVVQVMSNGRWEDCIRLSWKAGDKYRFKPEPKPDVVRYAEVNKYRCCDQFWDLKTVGDNLKLTFDGETGKLIKAEVIE